MKIQTLTEQLHSFLPYLRCTQCNAPFALRDGSLICENGHCYDLSTKGYVNLAPARDQRGEKYDAALFDSRARILSAGFYQPIADALCHELAHARVIADVGCGEGYYTRTIASAFPQARVIGLDLSRDAIQAAARQGHAPAWLIADLTRLPLRDGMVDALVDVLTPADYREFARVLKPGGLLLKVIPANDYLLEIRQALGDHLHAFSNERVIEHMEAHATILHRQTLRQTWDVTPEQAADFLQMTPMTFGISPDEQRAIAFERITIAMELLICRMKTGEA